MMHQHTYGRQNESPSGSGWLVHRVAAVLFPIVLFAACAPRAQQGINPASQDKKAQAVQPDKIDVSNIDSFVNSEIFSQLEIKTDESGKYVQIDDMRFRVNEVGAFGYQGQQWPNGFLNYDLAPEVRADAFKRSQFENGCKLITAQSGITCADISTGNYVSEANHVYVVISKPGEDNYSYVGRAGGRQSLGIINWENEIIIAHEIKHALGWLHEHQRPDRDAFVKINWNNIKVGKDRNFEVVTTTSVRGNYDFESIMHYGAKAFSKNDQKTIEPLPPYHDQEFVMGQRRYISKIDLAEVISVYGELGVRWCGLMRHPRREPPSGCFFECYKATEDFSRGRWWLCGSCTGAEICS